MEHLYETGVFGLKALIAVISIIVILVTLFTLIAKNKLSKDSLEIINLNEKFNDFETTILQATLSKKALKKRLKELKKVFKKNKEDQPNIYVIDFEGDIKASHVEQFRDEISSVLSVAEKTDEVLIRLESPGGMVHTYGLAAAQILRLKNAGVPVTACVDKVAASGGYMMACVADKIVAAPFAIVGSIGVLAQVPNLHRLLKKNNIDYDEYTAGEYKRTISLLGEISEKGKTKFLEDITLTHDLFKKWVSDNRPSLNIDAVSTGEHWYGQVAIEKGLVDELSTSDEYLLKNSHDKQIYQIKIKGKKSLTEKLAGGLGATISKNLPDWVMQVQQKRWY